MTLKKPSRYEAIYAVIRRIPKGKVATYGQIARLAGIPRHARQVGYALSAMTEDRTIPWHRVINAKGEISTRITDEIFENTQKMRLEAEGIVFNSEGRTSLHCYQWKKG